MEAIRATVAEVAERGRRPSATGQRRLQPVPVTPRPLKKASSRRHRRYGLLQTQLISSPAPATFGPIGSTRRQPRAAVKLPRQGQETPTGGMTSSPARCHQEALYGQRTQTQASGPFSYVTGVRFHDGMLPCRGRPRLVERLLVCDWRHRPSSGGSSTTRRAYMKKIPRFSPESGDVVCAHRCHARTKPRGCRYKRERSLTRLPVIGAARGSGHREQPVGTRRKAAMGSTGSQITLHEPATCVIRVRGALSSDWSERLGGCASWSCARDATRSPSWWAGSPIRPPCMGSCRRSMSWVCRSSPSSAHPRQARTSIPA